MRIWFALVASNNFKSPKRLSMFKRDQIAQSKSEQRTYKGLMAQSPLGQAQ